MLRRWTAAGALVAALAGSVFLGARMTGDAAHAGEQMAERDAALIVAAGRGDIPELRRLLRHGASLAATDSQGRTALVAAAYGDHLVSPPGVLPLDEGEDVTRVPAIPAEPAKAGLRLPSVLPNNRRAGLHNGDESSAALRMTMVYVLPPLFILSAAEFGPERSPARPALAG
jgi:hypothetical protein